MDTDKRLEPVDAGELSEEKKDTVVDGKDINAASVNDRGATFVNEATGPHGSGTVESVNERAATSSFDSPEERDAEGEAVAGANLGSRTYGDTTLKSEGSNKKGVAEQFNPDGDRFTSTEAGFTSQEAPMDIYPQDGRKFSDEVPPSEQNPNLVDGPITERDKQALLQANALSHKDVTRALRVLASNPIHTPDGPATADGELLQRPANREDEIENSEVAFPPAEFDTNRVRNTPPPVGDARGQERAANAVDELRQKAFDRDRRDVEAQDRRENH